MELNYDYMAAAAAVDVMLSCELSQLASDLQLWVVAVGQGMPGGSHTLPKHQQNEL